MTQADLEGIILSPTYIPLLLEGQSYRGGSYKAGYPQTYLDIPDIDGHDVEKIMEVLSKDVRAGIFGHKSLVQYYYPF